MAQRNRTRPRLVGGGVDFVDRSDEDFCPEGTTGLSLGVSTPGNASNKHPALKGAVDRCERYSFGEPLST